MNPKTCQKQIESQNALPRARWAVDHILTLDSYREDGDGLMIVTSAVTFPLVEPSDVTFA